MCDCNRFIFFIRISYYVTFLVHKYCSYMAVYGVNTFFCSKKTPAKRHNLLSN